MPLTPGHEPNARAFDAIDVLELINPEVEPPRITCVCEWDDIQGNPVRCKEDIEGDAQVKAWKCLLDLPWGSEDALEWRAAFWHPAELLSCERHVTGVEVEGVTMAWAAAARLFTFKAKGDRLLLGETGGSARLGVAVEGIRAPKPRRATTASRSRILARTREIRASQPQSSYSQKISEDLERALRKDSALGSNASRSDTSRQDRVADSGAESAEVFQLDEELQDLKDALWRDIQGDADDADEPLSRSRRLRSCSDPEVHINDTQSVSGPSRVVSSAMTAKTRTRRAANVEWESCFGGKPRQQEMYYAQRQKADLGSMDDMLERIHMGTRKEWNLHQARQKKWDQDKEFRQQTHSTEHVEVPVEEAERQARLDRERLEEEIRSRDEEGRYQHDMAPRVGLEAEFNTTQSSWAAYMHGWLQVLQLDATCSGDELYAALPRPVLGSELRAKYQHELSEEFERDVSDFYRNMPNGGAIQRNDFRRKLKAEVARFHPDKMVQRFPGAGSSEKVMALATRVTQVITLLIARA